MYWTEVERAAWSAALERGEATIAPAEGVYGYCADPFNPRALEQIMALKKRDANKGFIVLVRDVLQLSLICKPFGTEFMEDIYKYWGKKSEQPTTMILPAKPEMPEFLTGGKGTVAVRCPSADYMQEYLAYWGKPLVSTSLNISREPPAVQVLMPPKGIAALTLPEPLTGTVSRIYNPETKEWLR